MGKDQGKQRRVLEAVRGGCKSARDVEVELDFSMSLHRIARHLANLLRAGKIRKAGEVRYATDEHRISNHSVRAYLYEAVDEAAS